ncbi:MAG: DUF4347 domain-containing protein, partial [Burkholderiaceae bacterium]
MPRPRPGSRCAYPIAEPMEDRILHSADLAPLLAAGAGADTLLQQPLHAAPADAHTQRSEIVFVDAALPDAQSLIADLRAQRDEGRPIEIVTIGQDQDGIALIGATLAARQDITAVHVLAHGSDGALQLGNTTLDAQTLVQRAGEVAAWGSALTADADLLLYGCDLAQTAIGQRLVDDVALLTGADVAASTDLTGAAALGGNWTLEYQHGTIEASVVTSFAEQAQWQYAMATYTVTYGGDLGLLGAQVAGSLRWAISQANANAGTDTIVFAVDSVNLSGKPLLTSEDNANARGDLDITQSVNIVGNGAGTTVITGNGVDGVFDIRAGTVSISGLTVQGGRSNQGGGIRVNTGTALSLTDVVVQNNVGSGATKGAGIYSDGGLTLRNVVVRANGDTGSGDAEGGGIYLDDHANLDALNVEVRDNIADNKDGGGIYIKKDAVAKLVNTTVAGNSGRNGGGILNMGQSTTLFNVTLSGNAASQGGGLWSDDSAALNHVTVVGNVASSGNGGGGGIFAKDTDSNITTRNSLFSGNTGGNTNGKQDSLGYNLSSDSSGGFGATGDRSNTSAGIGALAYNGGFTRTHAIGPTSAARDLANPSPAIGTDQRGVAYSGGRADIGSYEYDPIGAPPSVSAIANQTIVEDAATAVLPFTVSDGESTPGSLVVTASSSNQSLLPNTNIVLGGANGNRTIQLTPFPNTNSAANGGTSTITVSVFDGGNTTTTSFILTVLAVNDAPTGTNKTVSTNEDTAYVFTVGDFGFGDPNDTPANALANVKITTLPGAGSLTLSGATVAAGQFVSAANIVAGNLRFTPGANASGTGYASFGFQVQDNGGTANGGVDLDAVARTMTLNVVALNDAPTGTSKSVTTAEDTAYTFTVGDFGFADPNDTPANALANVKISTVPASGSLALSGFTVTVGQFVAAADIAAGKLQFTPAANANGAGYASFGFQVQDDGGTANGGADLDAVVRTMTLNVSAVNDAPVGTSKTVSTNEDTAYVFTISDFGFNDPNDTPANALANVKISTLPAAGSLALSGVAVTSGQFVSAADIAAGKLRFAPLANASGAGYASFNFQVQDNGGTANGGVDLDAVARTMTIDVSAVNDAPVASLPPAQSTGSNTGVTFSSGFGNRISIADIDAGGNPVQLTLTAHDGTLTLSGTTGLSFSLGDGTGDASMRFTGVLADINAALDGLLFMPTFNFTGSTDIVLQVNDLGNSGSGGPALGGGTVVVNVAFLNSAPQLSGASNLQGILEDAVSNSGTAVASLLAGYVVVDTDPNALQGIAVTSVDNSNGVWQYSIDSGNNWIAFGSPGDATARLLSADSSSFVRFQPNADWNGTLVNAIRFRAWDATSGVAGGTADSTVNGGSSAFSTFTAGAGIDVTAVNDAPVGTSNSVSALEDTPYIFTVADFGFSDPGDVSGPNALAN